MITPETGSFRRISDGRSQWMKEQCQADLKQRRRRSKAAQGEEPLAKNRYLFGISNRFHLMYGKHRRLWAKKDLGSSPGGYTFHIGPHGSGLYKVK
jgi:hypothetical protein